MTDQDKNTKSDKYWPKDEFGQREAVSWWFSLMGLPIIAVIALVTVSLLPGLECAKRKAQEVSNRAVVVYCAQDQTYAEPILQDFQDETGIRVKAVYDSEAVKTVGLANRLLAERDHPQCDVFWGNEEMRTRQLGALKVWQETNGVAFFGARKRCLVVNTNLVRQQDLPQSLLELTNDMWRTKVAIAFPQFGTTAAHFHVLRQYWGDEPWRQWCRGLVDNDTRILDGNSTVVKMVGRGEAWIGLTDTDDVAAGQRDGLPVAQGPDLPGTLLFIPNTVGIVRNAPHPENAQRLADYLQSPETVERLIEAGAIQYAKILSLDQTVLQPNWDRLLVELDSTTEALNVIFLR